MKNLKIPVKTAKELYQSKKTIIWSADTIMLATSETDPTNTCTTVVTTTHFFAR